MNALPKQLINLIGALAVLAVLAAGILLVALPMFTQANTTAQEADTTSETNGIYEAQVSALRAQQDRFTEIQRDVTALRDEIPAQGDFDDVFELIGAAAGEVGAKVESVASEDLLPWTLRTAPITADGEVSPPPPAEPAPTEPAAPESAAPESTAPSAGTTAATSAARAAGTEGDPAQHQASFVVVVEVADAGAATRFLDALAAGPRLVSVVHAEFGEGDADAYRLTVNALAFVRAGD